MNFRTKALALPGATGPRAALSSYGNDRHDSG